MSDPLMDWVTFGWSAVAYCTASAVIFTVLTVGMVGLTERGELNVWARSYLDYAAYAHMIVCVMIAVACMFRPDAVLHTIGWSVLGLLWMHRQAATVVLCVGVWAGTWMVAR